MQEDSILIDLNPKKKAGARSLPCVLCPVVHWPVLLLLVQSGWTVPRRSPLTLRASSQVFSEHAAKHSVLRVAADTWPCVAPRVSEFAAAERIGAELLARVVGQCLALDDVSPLYFVAEPHVIWRQHADSSLVLFASAAKLCYSVCVPEQDASCCVAFIPEHAEPFGRSRAEDTWPATGSFGCARPCKSSVTRPSGCGPTTRPSRAVMAQIRSSKRSSTTPARPSRAVCPGVGPAVHLPE